MGHSKFPLRYPVALFSPGYHLVTSYMRKNRKTLDISDPSLRHLGKDSPLRFMLYIIKSGLLDIHCSCLVTVEASPVIKTINSQLLLFEMSLYR